MTPKRQPVTDDLVWCVGCENYHLPGQHDDSPPLGPPDLCVDCNVGEHSTCDFTLRREAGLCGCHSSRHEPLTRPVDDPAQEDA